MGKNKAYKKGHIREQKRSGQGKPRNKPSDKPAWMTTSDYNRLQRQRQRIRRR